MKDSEILDFMRIIAKYDLYGWVFWNADLKFFINCNDLFGPGSDAEDISTYDDVEMLLQCIKDCDEILLNYGCIDGPILYCCRRRKRNVWNKKIKHITKELLPLFNVYDSNRID